MKRREKDRKRQVWGKKIFIAKQKVVSTHVTTQNKLNKATFIPLFLEEEMRLWKSI